MASWPNPLCQSWRLVPTPYCDDCCGTQGPEVGFASASRKRVTQRFASHVTVIVHQVVHKERDLSGEKSKGFRMAQVENKVLGLSSLLLHNRFNQVLFVPASAKKCCWDTTEYGWIWYNASQHLKTGIYGLLQCMSSFWYCTVAQGFLLTNCLAARVCGRGKDYSFRATNCCAATDKHRKAMRCRLEKNSMPLFPSPSWTKQRGDWKQGTAWGTQVYPLLKTAIIMKFEAWMRLHAACCPPDSGPSHIECMKISSDTSICHKQYQE